MDPPSLAHVTYCRDFLSNRKVLGDENLAYEMRVKAKQLTKNVYATWFPYRYCELKIMVFFCCWKKAMPLVSLWIYRANAKESHWVRSFSLLCIMILLTFEVNWSGNSGKQKGLSNLFVYLHLCLAEGLVVFASATNVSFIFCLLSYFNFLTFMSRSSVCFRCHMFDSCHLLITFRLY